MTYNGVVSVFNGSEWGKGGTISNGKYTSYFISYLVRPSKTNTMKISKLIEHHLEDGSVEWNFYSRNPRGFIPRGLKVFVEVL